MPLTRKHTLIGCLVISCLTAILAINLYPLIVAADDTETTKFVFPRKHVNERTQSENAGRELYTYYCSLCHGQNGEADGFNSYSLKTSPAKHAEPVRMSAVSDSPVQEVIKRGRQAAGLSPQMAPWGLVLAESEIVYLTVFIRTLSKY